MLDMDRAARSSRPPTTSRSGSRRSSRSSTRRRSTSSSGSRSSRGRRGGRPPLARVDRRRADRVRDRDPLRQGRDLRGRASRSSTTCAQRLFRLAAEQGAAARRHRHASVEPVAGAADHRHAALPAPRGEPQVRRLAQQHLLLHVHVGIRGADRAVAVCDACARCCRSCSRCRRTRRSSTGATPGCTPRARRSSRGASRAAACTSPSETGAAYADLRRLPRPRRTRSSSTLRSGGASGRTSPSARSSSGSGRAVARGGLHRAAGLIVGLHRPGGARLRRRRLPEPSPGRLHRGELVAGDPLRARRAADRPRARRGVPGARALPDRLLRGPRPRARSSASTRALPAENGAQRQRRGGGRRCRKVVRGRGGATQRTYARGGGQSHDERAAAERGGAARAARGGAAPSVQDVLLQTIVTLMNLGARRLGLAGDDGRSDLEQARLAIEGVPRPAAARDPRSSRPPIRDALSQLQMAYAREARAPPASARGGGGARCGQAEAPPEQPRTTGRAGQGAPKSGCRRAPDRGSAPGPARLPAPLGAPARAPWSAPRSARAAPQRPAAQLDPTELSGGLPLD